jgi:hypothetical protein
MCIPIILFLNVYSVFVCLPRDFRIIGTLIVLPWWLLHIEVVFFTFSLLYRVFQKRWALS